MFSGFICKHNLLITTTGHVGNLFNAIFLDSKIAKKYSGSQTKTTHFSFWTVNKESVSDLKLTLSSSDLYKWFDLASGGNSYENDTFMLILIRHFVPNRHA